MILGNTFLAGGEDLLCRIYDFCAREKFIKYFISVDEYFYLYGFSIIVVAGLYQARTVFAKCTESH